MENIRRFGNPRTDEERMQRHQAMYGSKKLPPRGTGLGPQRLQQKADVRQAIAKRLAEGLK